MDAPDPSLNYHHSKIFVRYPKVVPIITIYTCTIGGKTQSESSALPKTDKTHADQRHGAVVFKPPDQ